MNEEKKVPAIRFKGFTDDWEQRISLCMELADICLVWTLLSRKIRTLSE